ncbi:TPA: hypothetical protein JS213_001865 [Escherichia coli]|nr:hypothetical protein [Escherichia coli]HAY0406660.1 hypothetical protein [Escherichia coli]
MARRFPAEYSHLNSLTNQISDRPVSHVSSNDRIRLTAPPPPISFEQGVRLNAGRAFYASPTAAHYHKQKSIFETKEPNSHTYRQIGKIIISSELVLIFFQNKAAGFPYFPRRRPF